MSRHRNIRRGNYEDDYEDVYGSPAAGQSVDERDMCVSPGTMAQFTFYRRDSCEGHEKPHLDSINEDADLSHEIDSVMYKMEIDDMEESGGAAAAVPVRQMVAKSELEAKNAKSVSEALHRLTEISDMKESDHCMIPLLETQSRLRIRRKLVPKKSQISPIMNFLVKRKRVINEKWFIPIVDQMREYAKSQVYSFDFAGPAVRFALNAKVKGKIPTPMNEIDAPALISRTGMKLSLGPNMKNEIPEKKTDEAINAQESLAIESKKGAKTIHPKTQQLASDLSSGPKSVPSSPQLQRANKQIDRSANIQAEYEKEIQNTKPAINLVVIGHVDAGKSTLMGRLLCDMGYISQKAMHRNETDSRKTGKASFLYAWVLDETEEERSRGITMDISQSRFETKHRRVTVLDAPGHKDFIPNMITGAAQADVAVLVVDATVGEFEAGFDAGGQTREHTVLVRSLGVSQLAVVINKLENVKWSQPRYNEIVSKLKIFLKQAGFKDADITYVPCSGLTGENLSKRSTEPHLCSWYSGPCLIEVIDNFRPPERPVTKPIRISIADIFKSQVSGVCIAARIDSGAIQTGQKLIILPAGEQCTVKSILMDDDTKSQAFAGDNVTLILLGCDPANMSIGNVICDPSSPCPVTSKFFARVVVFGSAQLPITKGLSVVLHYGNSSEHAIVKKIVSQLNRSTGEVSKSHPRCLSRNSSGVVLIVVSKPICVEKYSENKDLGRFMLRYSGNTIAAGLIDDIL